MLELLESFGGASAKAMFGGFGVYFRCVMVGLIADDMLYLKADDITRLDFEAQKLEPFRYKKKDKVFGMSYYQAPLDEMEELELLCEWVEGAYLAAVRGAKKKETKPRAKKQKPKT